MIERGIFGGQNREIERKRERGRREVREVDE